MIPRRRIVTPNGPRARVASPRAWAVVVALTLLAPVIPPAHAEPLGVCDGMGSLGYKVFLDAIVIEGGQPGAGASRWVPETIFSAIQGNIDALSLGEEPPKVLNCPHRLPQTSGDFSETEMQLLDESDVLVEVWLLTLTEQDPSGSVVHKARLNYVLVPTYDRTSPPGRISFHTETGDLPVTRPEDDVAALIRSVDAAMAGYYLVALGVKEFKLEHYPEAWSLLCRADRALSATPTTPGSESTTRLVQEVRRLAAESRSRLLNDPALSDLLSDVPQGGACPGE